MLEMKKGFELRWKVDFSFDFLLDFFEYGLAVCAVLGSCIRSAMLAYVCVNGIRSAAGLVSLCI